VHAGLWCGVLTPFTKLRYLSNEDHFVLACRRYLYVCLYNTYFKYKCNWTLHVFNGEFKIDIASPLCIHVSKVIQWAFVAEIRAHPILVLSMVFTNYRFDIVDFLYDFRVCFIFSMLRSSMMVMIYSHLSFPPYSEVDYDHMPFVTLMDVLTYSEVGYLSVC
jgi:hypothetical protein